jgi:hypothetical protein
VGLPGMLAGSKSAVQVGWPWAGSVMEAIHDSLAAAARDSGERLLDNSEAQAAAAPSHESQI